MSSFPVLGTLENINKNKVCSLPLKTASSLVEWIALSDQWLIEILTEKFREMVMGTGWAGVLSVHRDSQAGCWHPCGGPRARNTGVLGTVDTWSLPPLGSWLYFLTLEIASDVDQITFWNREACCARSLHTHKAAPQWGLESPGSQWSVQITLGDFCQILSA